MFYAALAGFFSALAAASVKIAFDGTTCKIFTLFGITSYVFCNIFMWWAHVRSLRDSASTFKAIAINTGISFFVTSLFGSFYFGEIHSVEWWCGILVLVSGTILVINCCEQKEKIV